MTQSQKDQVILFRTHFINDEIAAQYRLMKEACPQYDVIFLYDNTSNDIKTMAGCRFHTFNNDDIQKMGYKLWEGRGAWFHMDYAVLHFFLRYSHYRHYWVIEYDVRFEGNWRDFFSSFQGNDSDILSAYLRSYQDDPQWRWWNEHNLKFSKERWLAVFGPVIRFSSKALQVLDEGHKAGLIGYCEVVIPTLAREAGLQVSDIGEQFYDPLNSFNFNGIIARKKGKLSHPVKRINFFQKMVSIYRYMFRAKYDSHWSIQMGRFVVHKVFRFPRRSY